MDDDRAGEILDRRREHVFFVISRTLYLSIFSALPIQFTLCLRDDLVLRLGDEVQRVDDVVGVELLAIVELDALTQVELHGAVVDLLARLVASCPLYSPLVGSR